MDAPIKQLKSKDCNKHNQPIILYDPDPKKGGYCVTCIQEKTGMISAESYIEKLNVIINQADEQCNKDIELFKKWHLSITNYKSSLMQSLDKILKAILTKIEIREKFRQKLKQLSQSSEDEQKIIDGLQLECQNQQKERELVKHQVRKQLQDFQSKYFDNVNQLVSSFSEEQKIIIKDASQDQRKFQYELIQESCIFMEAKNTCWAFAFNRNNSILAVGCDNEIIIYEFNQGFIGKELQSLTNHTTTTCLQFMNNSNSFVSGGCDDLIIIWGYNQRKNKYFANYILKEHIQQINCILKGRNDDLLISGDDGFLKFWSIMMYSWSCIQTIQTRVEAMSLNELEDKLISSAYNQNFISVIQKGSDNQWSIVQQINIGQGGIRLCFTFGDQFVCKPEGDQLEVYDYNQETQKFEIINHIKLQQQKSILAFPGQYIQELQMLSFRYGTKVNLFKVNKEGNYQLIQQIDYRIDCISGRLTDDGQYLVTWDFKSKQIQVRVLRNQS